MSFGSFFPERTSCSSKYPVSQMGLAILSSLADSSEEGSEKNLEDLISLAIRYLNELIITIGSAGYANFSVRC